MKNKIIAVLDRIEGLRAVFLVEDKDSIEIPIELLPAGSKEGDIISFVMQKEDKKTKAEKDRVEGLIEKLSKKNKA